MIMAWRHGDWVIGVRRSGAVFAPSRRAAASAVNNLSPQRTQRCAEVWGGGRLARFGNFSAISASPREILNHAGA